MASGASRRPENDASAGAALTGAGFFGDDFFVPQQHGELTLAECGRKTLLARSTVFGQ